jgi:hypothetical protein
MNLAVQTTASTTAIWVIVIVMSIMTVILVSAASIADSWQARAGTRARGAARLGASVGDLINHDGALGPDKTSSGVPQSGPSASGAAWSQTREGGAAGDPAAAAEPVSPGSVPGQRPRNEQRPGDTDPAEATVAETITEAEAPTRPDLPPVPGRPSMPAQRRADADRAEPAPTGTSPQADDDPGRR